MDRGQERPLFRPLFSSQRTFSRGSDWRVGCGQVDPQSISAVRICSVSKAGLTTRFPVTGPDSILLSGMVSVEGRGDLQLTSVLRPFVITGIRSRYVSSRYKAIHKGTNPLGRKRSAPLLRVRYTDTTLSHLYSGTPKPNSHPAGDDPARREVSKPLSGLD